MENEQSHSSLMRVVLERRSIRRYTAEPVPRTVIETILTAGLWSPSAHNRQPWRWAVIVTPEQRSRLARAMSEQLRQDLMADQVPEAVIAQDVARSYQRISSAPVVIVVCLSMVDMDTYTDARRSHNELVMAVQSVAMAGQNMLLAARDAGLGACWLCAPLFCPNVVRDVLSLPEDWQAQGLITLGYPAETREKGRDSLATRVLWR